MYIQIKIWNMIVTLLNSQKTISTEIEKNWSILKFNQEIALSMTSIAKNFR